MYYLFERGGTVGIYQNLFRTTQKRRYLLVCMRVLVGVCVKFFLIRGGLGKERLMIKKRGNWIFMKC